MKLLKFVSLLLLAFAIGACNTATEPKKEETGKTERTETEKSKTEKKDETKNVEGTKSVEEAKKKKKPATTTGKKFDSPTATITGFVEAVKSKDVATIKNTLSATSVKALELAAKKYKKSFYDVLIMQGGENMKILPEMRNEKIDDDKATLEVKSKENKKWDTIPFVKEDDAWKIAFFTEDELIEMEEEME